MAYVSPLYLATQEADDAQGTNKVYIDTQVVNYMRKENFEGAIELKDLLTQRPPKFKLFFSAAHMGDYMRDPTDHKNDDIEFMGKLGIRNYLAYNPYKRKCGRQARYPQDVFYNDRTSQVRATQNYERTRKPLIDNTLLQNYDWFRQTLIEYEKDQTYLNQLDSRDAETFLALLNQVDLTSDTLTPELFLEKSETYWQDNVFTLPDKEASRVYLDASLSQYDLLKYKDEAFDLSQPNLIEQLADSEFRHNFQAKIEQSMYSAGLNFTDNYDEFYVFGLSFMAMQSLGVEMDRTKKFNVRSTREDAAHCYFASTCNYLITEDDGLYRRAKVLYGVLGIRTQVFKIKEFLEYINKQD